MMPNWTVVLAVFKRNLVSYFSNPIGYIFITLFVLAANYFAFCHDNTFFTNNLAEITPLHPYFPYMLLVFIPAITMSVWAEERRSGTEELLMTLPASDSEIVIGKYLSSLATYTIALIYCGVAQFLILSYLRTSDLSSVNQWGMPDVGLLISSYIGYWLMGAAMLAVGMVGSQLTPNVTVAFIYGLLLCVLFVGIGELGGLLGLRGFLREAVQRAGVIKQFEDFGNGKISFAGVFYFVVLTVVMLFINTFLLGRRHWAGSKLASSYWLNGIPRAVALLVAGVSLTILAVNNQNYLRFLTLDGTSNQIHKLSPETAKIINAIDKDKRVFIEAFITPAAELPSSLIEVRRNLIDLLEQLDGLGGTKLEVTISDTPRFGEVAKSAEKNYGIKGERFLDQQDGSFRSTEVTMGLACMSGETQKVIPFVYKETPIEYELVRMIQAVVLESDKRRKVGVLETDLQLFGRFDPMRGAAPEQSIITDLKQQYQVVQVSPDRLTQQGLEREATGSPEKTKPEDKFEKLDLLIVPMASSLTPPQLDRLLEYMIAGNPVLILDDPFPIGNPDAAPSEPKGGGRQNMMMGMQPPSAPKGDFRKLTELLGVEFNTQQIISQQRELYPRFELPKEVVFILGGKDRSTINQDDEVTAKLREICLPWPGAISVKDSASVTPKVTPLLRTPTDMLTTTYREIRKPGPFGQMELNQNPRRNKTERSFVVAARITGKFPESAVGTVQSAFNRRMDEKTQADKKAEEEKAKDPANKDAKKPEDKKDPPAELKVGEAKVIFIADADIVLEYFYQVRKRTDLDEEPIRSDNIAFFFNCVDSLIGDTSLVDLRRKAPSRLKLEMLDTLSKSATARAQELQEKSLVESTERLAAAQAKLDNAVKAIQDDKTMSLGEKRARLAIAQLKAQNDFNNEREQIETESKEKERQIAQDTIATRRNYQSIIKAASMLLPPIPILLLGLLVFFVRIGQEMEGVNPSRRV